VQNVDDKKEELVLSKASPISDTDIDLNEKDSDRNEDTELTQRDSSLSTQSASDTGKSTKLAGNDKNNNTKSSKNKVSTPKPVNKVTPLAAVNNPDNTKKPANVKDSPTTDKKPAANKPAPTKSDSAKSTPTKSTTVPAQLKTPKPSPNSGAEDNITVIRATGKPGNVIIKSDKNNVKVGEDFTITSSMIGGNNGTQWFLLENDKIISTMRRTDNSPDPQTIPRIITGEKPGTYTYKCVFENSFGRSESTTIQITVSD
jgi:hypothetical protein